MEDSEVIKNIETAIDKSYRKMPLFKTGNRYLAQWYMLLMLEEIVRVPIVFEKENFKWNEYLGRVEKSKGALKWALPWLDELVELPFKKPKNINWDLYGIAHEFLQFSMDYYEVVPDFTYYWQKRTGAKLIDEKTIKFDFNKKEFPFEVLEKINKFDPLNATIKRDPIPPEVNQQLENVLLTAKPDGKFGLKWKVNHNNLNPIVKYYLSENDKKSSLNSDWTFKNLTAQQLSTFFACLRSICFVHHLTNSNASRYFKIEAGAVMSALIEHTLNEWVDIISRNSGIAKENVKDLIRICTYDRSLPMNKRDISLQPFFPINDSLIICPLLILNGDLERNFLALISRNFKKEYDKVSNHFEIKMLKQCENIAAKNNLLFAARQKLPNEKLPDIDAAFFDEKNNILLLCQCKSVISPAEPNEVTTRSESQNIGLKQIEKIKTYCIKNLRTVWECCFPRLKFYNPTTYHFLLMSGFYGASETIEANIPCVEINHFESLLAKNNSLSQTCDLICSFSFLPKETRDYEIKEFNTEIDGYKFILDGYIVKLIN